MVKFFKIEENNFGIRKRLLEYDDVMNSQREVIYRRRRNALNGERIDLDIQNLIEDYCQTFVEKNFDLSYEDFSFELLRVLSIEPGFDADFFKKSNASEVTEKLIENVRNIYERRSETMITTAWPFIKRVYETQSAIYTNIAIPISDGHKMMNVAVNLKKAYESKGKELTRTVAKNITLILIDEHWKQHLRDMDDLKQSVQTATYEQKDPLLIYKFESFGLFKEVLEKVSKDVISFLLKGQIPLRSDDQKVEEAARRKTDMSKMQTSRNDLVTNGGEPKSNAPIRVEKRVGRNDPCPCGSGKKYKNCHGREE